jgi:CrcB protein
MKPLHIVVVAVGGGSGAVLRYLLGGWISERAGPSFPWGTLVINATGSFVLCLLATLALERFTLSRTWYVALGVGFCGGYTTFSTFSYETLRLAAEGSWTRAGINVLASVGAALASGALGILVGRTI